MMKQISIPLVYVFCFVSVLQAQETSGAHGNYFLEGVMETASGFNLKPNYTFSFFFTYDALDRYGSGTWSQDKNIVTFNSRIKPRRDFKLLAARRTNDQFVIIKFSAENPGLINGIECILYTARGRQKLFTGNDGIVKFPKNTVDSIQIFSPLFPDHPHTHVVFNKIHNSFEFAIDNGIAEVSFQDFKLVLTRNMLTGQHPLLNGNNFHYRKDE